MRPVLSSRGASFRLLLANGFSEDLMRKGCEVRGTQANECSIGQQNLACSCQRRQAQWRHQCCGWIHIVSGLGCRKTCLTEFDDTALFRRHISRSLEVFPSETRAVSKGGPTPTHHLSPSKLSPQLLMRRGPRRVDLKEVMSMSSSTPLHRRTLLVPRGVSPIHSTPHAMGTFT